jgi:hypothetical protein
MNRLIIKTISNQKISGVLIRYNKLKSGAKNLLKIKLNIMVGILIKLKKTTYGRILKLNLQIGELKTLINKTLEAKSLDLISKDLEIVTTATNKVICQKTVLIKLVNQIGLQEAKVVLIVGKKAICQKTVLIKLVNQIGPQEAKVVLIVGKKAICQGNVQKRVISKIDHRGAKAVLIVGKKVTYQGNVLNLKKAVE